MEGHPRVAIAGGTGFVGSALRRQLGDRFRWIGLTRSPSRAKSEATPDNTEWRQCDLYSFPRLQEAMAGADYAVYLVHSMLPSARLTQAGFADLDLLLADNFARAAAAAGVRQIVYLGGLIPDDGQPLSEHLSSRLEVEEVLASRGVPVTVLRAGIIFGPGGSSTQILINLVRRLPAMVLPHWTRSRTQSVDIRHVVQAVGETLASPDHFGKTHDLASHEAMTYREMILETAQVAGRHPVTLSVPVNWFGLSRLWVSVFSGVPGSLVRPLLQSLRHDLVARPNALNDTLREHPISFRESIEACLGDEGQPLPNPRRDSQRQDRQIIRHARRVRSVQRLPLPPGWDGRKAAEHYGEWLTATFRRLVQVNRDPDSGDLLFQVAPGHITLLRLSQSPHTREGDRQVYYIIGGLLTRTDVDPPGRLEFRPVLDNRYLIAAIHGYSPALPWFLYNLTQAQVHLWVMNRYGRHLEKQAAQP